MVVLIDNIYLSWCYFTKTAANSLLLCKYPISQLSKTLTFLDLVKLLVGRLLTVIHSYCEIILILSCIQDNAFNRVTAKVTNE